MVLFPPPFYFVFYISNFLSYIQNNFSYELARPIMGTIFLVIIYSVSPIAHNIVTGFAKTGLIAGVRNYSYSPFSSAKLFFVDFLYSSKIKI